MVTLLGKKPLPDQVDLEDFFPSRAQREKQRVLLSRLARITDCYCLSRFNTPVINLGARCDLAASGHWDKRAQHPDSQPQGVPAGGLPGSSPGLRPSPVYIQPLLTAGSRHDKSHQAGDCTSRESDRELWDKHLFCFSEFTACKTATEEPSRKLWSASTGLD